MMQEARQNEKRTRDGENCRPERNNEVLQLRVSSSYSNPDLLPVLAAEIVYICKIVSETGHSQR